MSDPLSYQYVVYLGDDDGKISSLGTTWWAANREFDCIGDGKTATSAINNCIEGVLLKMQIYEEQKREIPKPNPFMKVD